MWWRVKSFIKFVGGTIAEMDIPVWINFVVILMVIILILILIF